MRESIAQRQSKALESGFLDLMGTDIGEVQPAESLSVFADSLAMLAAQYMELARTNLEAAERVSSGDLSDSIIASEVMVMGQKMTVEIRLADYFKFVDKGVKGWQNEKGGNSPYQFKNKKPGGKMVADIAKWIRREGLMGRAKVNTSPRAGLREQRRASLRDAQKNLAYGIAYNIKKKGLKPSRFWTKTTNEMQKRIRTKLGLATKVTIKQMILK